MELGIMFIILSYSMIFYFRGCLKDGDHPLGGVGAVIILYIAISELTLTWFYEFIKNDTILVS